VTQVVNASPLITLARAGLQDILLNQSGELLVPHAVAFEIEAGPEGDPARALLAELIGKRLPPIEIPPAIIEWRLGPGESAVIAETLRRPGAEAILDDAAGRRCARSFGIPVVGTLGLLIRAKRSGHVSSVAPLFVAIRDAGLFFSDDLARALLAAVQERWPVE
jgi:predicted nucleic acid-binding protein